jgi:hypothetical protein
LLLFPVLLLLLLLLCPVQCGEWRAVSVTHLLLLLLPQLVR